jgi:glycosyltransferase involved in cell wall biosynthesis
MRPDLKHRVGDLPTITVVTPTYNHADILEDAIRSVLDQGYPNLEYVVVDGGSDDGTEELLERYRPRLHAVVSEPDRGPHDALNKGFALTSGSVMGWLNADDTLLPGSLLLVGTLFRDFPDVRWLTGAFTAIDPRGRPATIVPGPRWTRWHLLSRYAHRWIAQTSTFWRRDLWEESGATMGDIWGNEQRRAFPHNFDFELWARLSRYGKLQTVTAPIGCHRYLKGQQGRVHLDVCDYYAAVIRQRERPRTLKERVAALLADASSPLGRLRLGNVEGAFAGAMGAPRLIVFDPTTYRFRRRQRLESSRKLLRRMLRIRL